MKIMPRICPRFFVVSLIVMSATRATLAYYETGIEKYDARLKNNPEVRVIVEARGATSETVPSLSVMDQHGKRTGQKYDPVAAGKSFENSDGVMIAMLNLKTQKEDAQQTDRNDAVARNRSRSVARRRSGTLQVKDPDGFAESRDKQVLSGPQSGGKLPGFTAEILVGDHKGEVVDIIKDVGSRPHVLFFQGPTPAGVRGLIGIAYAFQTIKQHHPDFRVSVVFLDKKESERFTGVLQRAGVDHIALSTDGRDGPGAYGLNSNIAQTVILARDQKVTRSFALPQGMLFPDPFVMGGIAELIGKPRETVAAWFKPAKRPGDMERQNARAAAAKMNERRKLEAMRQRPQPIEVKDPDSFAESQDKQILSGPQAGEKLPALPAEILVGDDKGEVVDIIKNVGDRPHVLVFQDNTRAGIRGIFSIANALKTIQSQHQKDVRVAVVFLDNDKDALLQSLGRFANLLQQWGVDQIALSTDGRDGPGAYGLNRNVAQTIILAQDGKVTRNFAFPQGTLFPDPFVMGGVAEMIGVSRETVAGWFGQARDMVMRSNAIYIKLGELYLAEKIDRSERSELYEAWQSFAASNAGDGDLEAASKLAFKKNVREFVAEGIINSDDAAELNKAAELYEAAVGKWNASRTPGAKRQRRRTETDDAEKEDGLEKDDDDCR